MFTIKKCKRFIAVLLGIIITVGFLIAWLSQNKVAYAATQDDWSYDDCENLIDFIDKNFDDFVSEYNKTVQDDNYLNATSIEYSSIIYLVEDNNYGVYIDFDNDNGYIVSTGNYNIYELEVSGDLDYLRKESNIFYSYLDGFVYINENNTYQRYEEVEVINTCFNQLDCNTGDSNTVYSGQSEAGDGEIDPSLISDYISERYPDYAYVSSSNNNLRASYPYSNQYYTSYYIKQYTNSTGTVIANSVSYSEGNCVLNAVYSLILDWANRGYINNIPTSLNNDLSERITSDPLYSSFGTGIVRSESTTDKSTGSSGSKEVKYYKWVAQSNYWLNRIPTLYSEVRDYAVDVNGYTPETGYNTSKVPSTIQYVINTLHGNSIGVNSTTTISNVLSLIDNNIACYLAINNSSTYGNHGTVIIGYQKYSYTTGWWVFTSTKYAYFYELADSWNTTSMYFDPNTSASPSLTTCYMV